VGGEEYGFCQTSTQRERFKVVHVSSLNSARRSFDHSQGDGCDLDRWSGRALTSAFGKGCVTGGKESLKKHIDTHLDEADVLGVLAEALPADVQVVLADDTPLVRAHAAVGARGEKTSWVGE